MNKGKFNFLYYALFIIALVILLGISVETYYRNQFGFKLAKFNLFISPKPLFKPNSSLGWELNPGKYSISINDISTTVTAIIDSQKIRKTLFFNSKTSDDTKVLQLYGCSCTFGYSVEDSSTQASQLQKLLPNYKIENLGVPAYGLAQMFEYLKQNVKEGNKPDVAVINYSTFHDKRTPLHKQWSSQLWWATTQGNKKDYKDLSYPYFIVDKNELVYKSKEFNKLSKNWSLSDKSAFINRMNFLYFKYHDSKLESILKDISIKTAVEIMEYCLDNNIIPIFAFLVNSDDVEPDFEIIEILKLKNYNVLNYELDYGQPGYNNCPYDCGHPSALAYKLFAENLYHYMINKGVLIID